MTSGEFAEFLARSLGNAAQQLSPGALAYIFMDWRHAFELTVVGRRIFERQLNLCVWAKTNGGMGSFYRSAHELVFLFKKAGGSHTNNVQLGRFGRNRTNVWSHAGANTFGRGGEEGDLLALHPTVKPVALLVDILLDATVRGDIVLDPFCGSGSICIAAEKVGRRAYGIELDRCTSIPRCAGGSVGQAKPPGWNPPARPSTRWPPSGPRRAPMAEPLKSGNAGRFQPGRSGNPNGRPRKANTVAEAVRDALDVKVPITANGRQRRISKRDAAAMQLANRSASGDLRANKLAFDLASKAEARADAGAPPPETLSVTDQEIVERLMARLGLIRQHQDKNDEPDYSI